MSDSHLSRTLDYYLADINNHRIRDDLEHLGHPDILAFFHRFYQWIDLVEQGKPSEALKEIEVYAEPGGLTVLILYHLRAKFRGDPLPSFPAAPIETTAPEGSLFYLDNEYERWKQSYPPDIYAQDDPSELSRAARTQLWGHYMVTEVIDNMITKLVREGEKKRALELQIEQAAQASAHSQVEEIVHAVLAASGTRRNPEFTLNRQVLALGYILQALKVRNIDKIKQANFVEFLINKTNKTIYDALRELDDCLLKNDGKDVEYVSAKFKELGLDELASKIEQDLKQKRGV